MEEKSQEDEELRKGMERNKKQKALGFAAIRLGD